MTDAPSFRLLFVEDDPDELNVCRSEVERYRHQNHRTVELIECPTLDTALATVDNTIDGAIIDIRLGTEGDEGNRLICHLQDKLLRIPVAILTATPSSVDTAFTNIGVYKKGEAGSAYSDLFDKFWSIHKTGITRILGGRGAIESVLNRVFLCHILPQIETWVRYGEIDSSRAEKSLLRHIMNHLIQIVNEDEETVVSFPEEFYLFPSTNLDLQTGSILKEKTSERLFVVMNPDCDLVVRDHGKRNTDVILVAEILQAGQLFPWFDGSDIASLNQSKRDKLASALRNKTGYYHCLPGTHFFALSFINFRNLSSVSDGDISNRFTMPPMIQISPPFTKDIVARFSSYYARQGQPDIDFNLTLSP